jgi:hypothetical protein
MAITIHQSAGAVGGMGDTSAGASFSTTPTTGRYVIVCVNINATHQNLGSISVSDNQSNTYTARYTNDIGTRHKQIFFTAPISTSSGTFTVTLSVASMESWAETEIRIAISEVSGLDSDDYVDQSGSASGSSTTASVDLSAMESDTVVFAQCYQIWDVSMTRADGWSSVYAPENQYGVISREGNYDPSWTLGLSNDWYVSAVGFNASSGGAGGFVLPIGHYNFNNVRP